LGTEIVTLRSELRKLPAHCRVLADGDRFNRVQRSLDQRFALKRMSRARRLELLRERDWILSETRGYQRGLALVGAGGSATRLQRHLEERAAAAARVAAEVEEVDRRIESIEHDILTLQSEMVEILRRSIADSEEKIRGAASARRRRLAVRLGDVASNTMWSPVAVMGYRGWKWSEDGFQGVRQPWLRPRLSAACSAGAGLPHTDGRCAEVAYGCGIYAAKSFDVLINEFGLLRDSRVAIGLVGLERKVVEHERGYRSEIATVLALAVIDWRNLYLIDDRDRLASIFAPPVRMWRLGTAPLPLPSAAGKAWPAVRTFLEEQARRNQTWTSESPSE
jgi:hypothetical protein